MPNKTKPSFIEQWKLDQPFPVRWLSYKHRISKDIERLFNEHPDEAASVLDDEYIENLSKTILRTEDWILKLFSAQFAITTFFILGFLSDNPSISLFGVSLSGIAGLKEILVALWFTMGLATTALMLSRDTLTLLARTIQSKISSVPFAQLSLLKVPSPFNIFIYTSASYEDWIFTARRTKILTFMISLLLVLAFAIFFFASLALSIYLLRDIYLRPTLGFWSYALLTYSYLILATHLLLVIRINIPMAYRDKSELKTLTELEKVDPRAAARLRQKIFSTK